MSWPAVVLAVVVLVCATAITIVVTWASLRADEAHGRKQLSREIKTSWDASTLIAWTMFITYVIVGYFAWSELAVTASLVVH